MKVIKSIFVAAIWGMVTGCATTTPPSASNQVLSVDSAGDGNIKQKTEFKDLPADMRDAITNGG